MAGAKALGSTRDELPARPTTSSSVQLSPLFHWNLNSAVLQSLSPAQVQQLYRLFRFYDSSCVGDALPALDCRRFVQLLRDAGLVASPVELPLSSSPPLPSLSVTAVETIFAEAVMGKLRAYLDADQRPALTFQLFCGALLNCAMVLHPGEAISQPMAALNQLFNRLFAPFQSFEAEPNRQRMNRSPSVASHVSIGTGADAYWRCGTAHSHLKPLLPTESSSETCETFVTSFIASTTPHPVEDFRQLEPFQELIARFTRDEEQEAQAIARLEVLYSVPEILAGQFPPDLFAILKERFQVFDVFDQGALPPREVFALLAASLVKRLDLTDVYDVLAVLLEPQHEPTSSSKPPETALITLSELLQALLKCRRPKTTSNTTTSTSNSSTGRRKAANHSSGPLQSDAASTIATFGTRAEASTEQTRPEQGKRQSSKPTAPPKMMHHASVAKQTHVAKAAKSKKGGGKKHNTGANSTSQATEDEAHELNSPRTSSASDDGLLMDHKPLVLSVEFAPVPETKMDVGGPTISKNVLTVFLLLGGEHDGAICYIATLDLVSRQLTERHGVFFTSGRHEMLEHKAFPPQSSQEIALLLLKKRLAVKEREGFECYPLSQMQIVDDRLRQLQLRQPHYRSPTKQAQRSTTRDHDKSMSPETGENSGAPRTLGDLVDARSSSALRVPGIRRSSSTEDLIEMVKDSFLQSHLQAKRARAAAEKHRQEMKELARQPRCKTPLASRMSVAALAPLESALIAPPPDEFGWLQRLNQSICVYQTQFDPVARGQQQQQSPLRPNTRKSMAKARSTGHLQPLAL